MNWTVFVSALSDDERLTLREVLQIGVVTITPEERELIRTNKIGAIKAWRERTGLGLVEARMAFTKAGLW